MLKTVLIRLKNSEELVLASEIDMPLSSCESIIVERDGKEEVGVIINPEYQIKSELIDKKVRILRKITPADKEKIIKLEELEKEASEVFQELLLGHRLPIKLIKTVAAFGENKLVFYFFSEERVDFRGLVRDLAKKLHRRVELWQIDRREEAKILGGLGPCGLVVCCKKFLETSGSVSVHMAKVQGIQVSPDKISGVCGRLMCCLKYELSYYDFCKSVFPDVGETVIVPGGEAQVIGRDIFKELVRVVDEEGNESEYSLRFIRRKVRANPDER